MTGKVVNLRRARKLKARKEARAGADSNAALNGEAKAVKSLRKARDQLETRRLEGHRREGADAE